MAPVSILLNILWILIGGAWMAAAWLIAAVIMAITIIGLPWARAALNIAVYTLLPFGQRAVRRDSLTGRSDIGTGPLGMIGNLIWLVLAGWSHAQCGRSKTLQPASKESVLTERPSWLILTAQFLGIAGCS